MAIGVLRAPRDFATDTAMVAAERTISRLFLVQPRTLDALQATIPAEEPYFLGLTWLRRVGPIVGRDDIPNLGYWIYPKVVDEAQDVAGYAAPGLIGEAWANFGPAGIAIFALFGVGLEALAAWVASHRAGSWTSPRPPSRSSSWPGRMPSACSVWGCCWPSWRAGGPLPVHGCTGPRYGRKDPVRL